MKRLLILFAVIVFGIGGVIGFDAFPDAAEAMLPQPVPEETEATLTEEELLALSTAERLAVQFSLENTFYNTKIEVELSCLDPDAVIYYTLDGSEPDTSSTKYNIPLSFSARAELKVSTVRAIAVSGGDTSAIATKSYIVGRNVFERFSESTLVFVLTTDPYNLYDHEYGVAIEGALREEWQGSHPGAIPEPYHPANYNISGRESERDMYVEAFDSTGRLLIDQAAGARVVGGYSRAVDQKSWRLIARNLYSEGNGMFKYSFFSDAVNSEGQPIFKFDRLTLRNGGNDREFGMIRDEVSMELAKQAGFPDTMEAVPAAVFLGGEYYGFSWLKEAYCNGYLEQMYGGEKENYQIISNTENMSEGEEFAVEDYQYMYGLAVEALEGGDEARFTNDKVFEEFCSLVDLDNLMLYYAIQVYIDNKDWPGNNMKAWRYYASEGEEITNPYNDGKWRFLLFDAEYAWSLYGNNNRTYRDNTLKNVLSGNHMGGATVLLNALFQREDMQAKFANTVCDLISGAFSPENALEVIEQIIEEGEAEAWYALDNGYTSTWSHRSFVNESRDMIREFAQKRPEVMLEALKSQFELDEDIAYYTVTLNNFAGAEAWLNTQKLTAGGERADGRYLDCYEVQVRATAYSGYEFRYWEVNGVQYTGAELMLSAAMADEGGHIEISLRLEKLVDGEALYISEVCTGSDSDWIELYNPNGVAVSTKNYYLSDDEFMLNEWKIPTVSIAPGEAIIITTNNNKSADSLHKMQTNFSLKLEETLYLSDLNGTIISAVAIVEMNETQSLTRRLDGTYSMTSPSPGVHEEK